MSEWKNIKINGITKINKCVGEYLIFHDGRFPFINFRVQIYEDCHGSYTGIPNFGIKSCLDGSLEVEAGFGKTESECLEDTLTNLLKIISKRDTLTPDDFEWTEDF